MQRARERTRDLSKIDELIATTKLNDLINKKEEEKASKTVLWILAVIGAVAAVAAIAYAVYCFFTPDYLEDFEDDFDVYKADFNRAFKIWKYYVQKNLWRLDEYATFKLEG